MFCPVCQSEYRQGFDRCVDCYSPLVHELPARPEAPGEDWEQLRVVSTETEAKLIQGYLESEGIPCLLESLVFHAEPFNFGPLSHVRVHVPAERTREADKLLESLPDASVAEGISPPARP